MDKYYEEAVRIADELLASAKYEGNRAYWESLGYEKGKVYQKVSEDLYSGVAGISFFLLQVYEISKEERFKKVVLQSAAWLESYCRNNPTEIYSFYTGRMGIAYYFVQLYRSFKDERYLKFGVEIAKGAGKFPELTGSMDDLINGTAGTLLGLLHVHDASGDVELLNLIEKYTAHLLENMNLHEHGCYWDRSDQNIQGLCGFSHGAAGVGYVFLELGSYFRNEVFYHIAHECFRYENAHFDESTNNWPDFRKAYYDSASLEKFKERYTNRDVGFFQTPGQMVAWCHGAPGIGLSRLRGYQLTSIEEYLSDLKRALAKTIETMNNATYGSFTLCHGHFGNAVLLLETAEFLGEGYEIEQMLEAGLFHRTKFGDYLPGFAGVDQSFDTSLFMGTAGIGYFFLLASREGLLPSLLKPDVQSTYSKPTHGILALTETELSKLLVKKVFPGYDQKKSTASEDLALSNTESFQTQILSRLEASIQDDERWNLEILKIDLERNSPGDAYLKFRHDSEVVRNLELLGNGMLGEQKFFVPPGSSFHQLSGGELVLLIPMAGGVVDYTLTGLSQLVLPCFNRPITLEEVSEIIHEQVDIDESEKEEFQQMVMEQVSEALAAGILYHEQSAKTIREIFGEARSNSIK